MKRCKNCRFGQKADDNGTPFYWCRFMPPTPISVDGKLIFYSPSMAPTGWCGQFRLSIWKWLFGSRK